MSRGILRVDFSLKGCPAMSKKSLKYLSHMIKASFTFTYPYPRRLQVPDVPDNPAPTH